MMQRSYSSQPALSIFSSPTVGTSYSTYTLRCSGCSVGVTMTAGHFNDPEHWRQQADEARATARQLPNPDSKAVMMRIAVDYDRLAERARARADEVANRRK